MNNRDLIIPEQIEDASADIQRALADEPSAEVRELYCRKRGHEYKVHTLIVVATDDEVEHHPLLRVFSLPSGSR